MLLLAMVLLLVGTPAHAQLHDVPDRATLAFENVNVLPMTAADEGDAGAVLPAQTVVVSDGRIVAMGPSGQVDVPDGALRVDGSGRFLLPGLAEIHAHVPPGQDPPRELVEEYLFLYLANGITTIRGMLGAPYQLELREELRRGEVLGPRFYVGAPSVNANTAPTPEAAEALVRAHAEAGYDFLKIHPGVPRDSWDRMVEVAREVGITWAGHIPADVGIDHAVATGMATIDHLDGFLQATRRDDLSEDTPREEVFAATDPAKLEALVERLARAGVWQVPTQYLWNHLNGYVDADSLLALPEFQYISEGQRMGYRNQAEQRRRNPEITPASDAAHRAMRQDFLRAAHSAGVPILMGTDSPQLFNVPGFALHREIPLMLDAGMSPYEVLVSGTRAVGEYVASSLGQPGDFGTVQAGQRADLLLVDGNPLEDMARLQDPVGVVADGRWLTREAIRAGLDSIAVKYGDEGR
ncbi:MAG: amidohydrolase [Gemmatimonadales bacterium]|nr:MAG: amidohydrolase [Gemmatimonadales bacterium]